MYLVEDRRDGPAFLVFTWADPWDDGYAGDIIEGVSLDYDRKTVHSRLDGHDRPEVCVGRAEDNPKHYKVFKYKSELQSAGYQPVAGNVLVFGTWADYIKLRHPEQLEDEQWYEYLDELDEAARRRRQRVNTAAAPAGKSRDEVAAWVARTHRIVDSSIREVRYLPQGAPPDEIRLLELNDRLAGTESRAEAIDFGLDIEGARFRLLVADITSDQFERIQQDPSLLPPGWSLDGSVTWRRGA